jgi:hypothetical protein
MVSSLVRSWPKVRMKWGRGVSLAQHLCLGLGEVVGYPDRDALADQLHHRDLAHAHPRGRYILSVRGERVRGALRYWFGLWPWEELASDQQREEQNSADDSDFSGLRIHGHSMLPRDQFPCVVILSAVRRQPNGVEGSRCQLDMVRYPMIFLTTRLRAHRRPG